MTITGGNLKGEKIMSNYDTTTTFGIPFVKSVYRFLKQDKEKEDKNFTLDSDLTILDVNDRLKDFLVSELIIMENEPKNGSKNSIDNGLKVHSTEGYRKNGGSGYWIYKNNTLKVTQLFKDTIFIYALNGWLDINSRGEKYK